MRLLLSCTGVIVAAMLITLNLRTIADADSDAPFALTSSGFQNEGAIPERYTCSGQNISPALEWTGVTGGTRSLVLIVDDPDAPMGTFVHWVVYNLAPAAKGLPENVSPAISVEDVEQGVNGSGAIGYMGPCPPPGKPHHYHFRLYALDQKLDLREGATAHQVETAIQGHVVGSTQLVGIFER
jgi:Raf kinase inhibitor-like YbhB/YbcL family protein